MSILVYLHIFKKTAQECIIQKLEHSNPTNKFINNSIE